MTPTIYRRRHGTRRERLLAVADWLAARGAPIDLTLETALLEEGAVLNRTPNWN